MQDLLSGGPVETVDLHQLEGLARVVDAGWTVGPDGALLLAACWGDGWRRGAVASELGQYEYEVNEVYVDLHHLSDDMEVYLSRAAKLGLTFAKLMLKEASRLPEAGSLRAVVSVSIDELDEDFLDQGVMVRFFSTRGTYPDWYQDLERFKLEAIALLDLSDLTNWEPAGCTSDDGDTG